MNARTEYITGLRAFADWLETNTEVDAPSTCQRLLLPLTTNAAVEEFAAKNNLTVTVDDGGDKSCQMAFGSITYYAYSYADFAETCAKNNEKQARSWAARNGVKLVEPDTAVAE
ncbi:hypothetical protein ACIOEX_01190 [Streptomyces sp. NPDC087850]|uniref:hypothetical protein n=1 Tax=Streptomyces sp. NPDC087850 TaxID=3365809 RepID=UPI00381DF5FD